ncbi:MAG: amidohydrolase family protein [Alphaproteobacteria bacterium]
MIDGGVFLGRDPTVEIGAELDELMRRLDRFGADRALAASFKGIYYDYREGNDEMLRSCESSDGRLLPVATVNLSGYDCTSGYLRDLKQRRFVALGLYAPMQAWDWSDHIVRKIAEQAAELDFPIQAGVANARELGALARSAGPVGATVMVRWLRGGGYNNVADMIAVAEDYPGFRFDVGTTTQSGAIEYLAERIGASRLFMASNAPLTLEAAPYFLLYAARLSAEDRAAIEHGTLANILGIDAPSGPARRHPMWEAFRDSAKIDTHWHTGTWNIIEPRIDFADMSEDFDRFNYRIVVSSSIRALNYDLPAGNAETLAFVESDPRVFGLIVVNPYRIAESLEQIDRYRDHPRFVGLKTIQDYYQDREFLRLDHPNYAPLLERARELELPVMAHLPGMAEVAAAFPEVTFVAAHSTWRYEDLAKLPNVYFDIATSTALRSQANLAGLIEAVGEDRVVFSSDAQLMSPAWTLGKLVSIDLPEATLEKVLRVNALSAFPRLAAAMREAA